MLDFLHPSPLVYRSVFCQIFISFPMETGQAGCRTVGGPLKVSELRFQHW